LYVALAATWVVLLATVVAIQRGAGAVAVVTTISPMTYFLSEFKVLIHYLKLSFYPVGLSCDYGWKPTSSLSEVLPYAIPILMLQGATLWGLYRRKPQAFLGAWFFGILAVTSSIMPIPDLIFEHRMYLSLAAVVTAVVLGADWLSLWLVQRFGFDLAGDGRWVRSVGLVVVTLLVTGLGLLTVRRNMDYKSSLVLWTDTINKQPQCARAHINLGKLLVEQGLENQGIVYFREGLKVLPESAEGHINMGWALLNLGRAEEAKEHLLIALAQYPDALASYNLGMAYLKLGEVENAVEQLSKSVEMQPGLSRTHYLLGVALAKQGRGEEALRCFNEALQIDASYVDALNEKALLLIGRANPSVRNPEEAMVCARKAVTLSKERYGKSLDVLAQVYADAGRYGEAIKAAQQASLSLLARQDAEFAQASAARLHLYREKLKAKEAKS
jgi:tetratricopeptide (TPR) repeat protein